MINPNRSPRIRPNRGSQYRPFLKSEIEAAIHNTQSMAKAAEYLHVTYVTLRKWAKKYGLWKPASSKGIKRTRVIGAVPLNEIFENKRPHYNRTKLRERLIRAGVKPEECELCGYSQRNPINGRVPLSLYNLDGNKFNMALDNLQLRCYNCLYITSDLNRLEKEERIANLGHRTNEDMQDVYNLSNEDLEALHDEIVRDAQQELSR